MSATTRIHHFRDENDDRTVVRTIRLSTGSYRASVIEGLHYDLGDVDVCDVRGYGHSRLAAITDLNAEIEKELAR